MRFGVEMDGTCTNIHFTFGVTVVSGIIIIVDVMILDVFFTARPSRDYGFMYFSFCRLERECVSVCRSRGK